MPGGLGYYTGARNLHACCKEIAKWKGVAQKRRRSADPSGRRALYRGDSVIAFDQSPVPVDGNVER